MDFPIQINAIKMGLSIIYFKDHILEFPKYDVYLSLKTVLMTAKSIDPDEMQRSRAFHLDLHFLSKYPF